MVGRADPGPFLKGPKKPDPKATLYRPAQYCWVREMGLATTARRDRVYLRLPDYRLDGDLPAQRPAGGGPGGF